MRGLVDWIAGGNLGCVEQIQASSIELTEPITNEVEDLGEVQVKLVQNVETAQLKKENRPVNGNCRGLHGFQFLTVRLENLDEQAAQASLIQLAESDNHEIQSLGDSKVQVLESSASVSSSWQSGKRDPDCVINAAVDEETSDGFSFSTSMAYAPHRPSGHGYYRNSCGFRGGYYARGGRDQRVSLYCPALYEEEFYVIEDRLAHRRR